MAIVAMFTAMYSPNTRIDGAIRIVKVGNIVTVGQSTEYLTTSDPVPVPRLMELAPTWIRDGAVIFNFAATVSDAAMELINNRGVILMSTREGHDDQTYAESDVEIHLYSGAIGVEAHFGTESYFIPHLIGIPKDIREVTVLRDIVYRAYNSGKDVELRSESFIQKFICQYYELMKAVRKNQRDEDIQKLDLMLDGVPPVDLLIRMIHEFILGYLPTWVDALIDPRFQRGVLRNKDLLALNLVITLEPRTSKGVCMRLADMLTPTETMTSEAMGIVSSVFSAVQQSDEAKEALSELQDFPSKERLLHLASLSNNTEEDLAHWAVESSMSNQHRRRLRTAYSEMGIMEARGGA